MFSYDTIYWCMLNSVEGRVVGTRAQPPKQGAKKTLPPQDLPEDLAVDLWAFSEAHYGAPEARVVRSALRLFIDAQLAGEPQTRQRFNEAKARLLRSRDNVRAIEPRSAELKIGPGS